LGDDELTEHFPAGVRPFFGGGASAFHCDGHSRLDRACGEGREGNDQHLVRFVEGRSPAFAVT
jgi:hypothetical protein